MKEKEKEKRKRKKRKKKKKEKERKEKEEKEINKEEEERKRSLQKLDIEEKNPSLQEVSLSKLTNEDFEKIISKINSCYEKLAPKLQITDSILVHQSFSNRLNEIKNS